MKKVSIAEGLGGHNRCIFKVLKGAPLLGIDLYATLKRVLPLTLVQRQKQDGYCVLILVADVVTSSFVQITQRCPCKIGCQLFLSLMKYIDCAN